MPREGCLQVARPNVPKFYGLIDARGGKSAAIRTECYAHDHTAMTSQRVTRLFRDDVPQPGGLIVTARCQHVAIGCVGHCGDVIVVPGERCNFLSAVDISQTGCAIAEANRKRFAVRT